MSHPIPEAALDDRLAFVGTAGSGKTYSAIGAVELLLAKGARCVIIDPLDATWGLRLMFDGETASPFPVVIFGGSHGDLPINEHAGALIGETVAGMRESCIVSLGAIGTKAGERRFMLAFLTALYRHASGEPLHLVIDEADMFAPQVIRDRDGEAARLLGQMETIVRRGRIKGFRPWLITQRPAVLNKDVLSQADGLIALKLTASQDRAAIGAWIEGQADRADGKAILASLPTMQRGQGVVWIPGRGVLETVTFPAKITYDSSRTPQRGETLSAGPLKPLDLGALKERLATVEQEAKANDPKALKAEIARLKAEAAKQHPGGAYSRAEIEGAERAGYERGLEEGERRGHIAGQAVMLTRVQTAVNAVRVDKAEGSTQTAVRAPAPKDSGRDDRASVAPVLAPPRTQSSQAKTNGALGAKGKVLDALAWWKAAGFPQIDRRRACIMAGYSPRASTFGVYLSELARDGLVSIPSPGMLSLTDAGEARVDTPDFEGPEALVRAAKDLLSPAEVKVFVPVLERWPDPIGRGELADEVGLSRTASTLGVYLSKIAGFGLIETGRGEVRAADWLFP